MVKDDKSQGACNRLEEVIAKCVSPIAKTAKAAISAAVPFTNIKYEDYDFSDISLDALKLGNLILMGYQIASGFDNGQFQGFYDIDYFFKPLIYYALTSAPHFYRKFKQEFIYYTDRINYLKEKTQKSILEKLTLGIDGILESRAPFATFMFPWLIESTGLSILQLNNLPEKYFGIISPLVHLFGGHGLASISNAFINSATGYGERNKKGIMASVIIGGLLWEWFEVLVGWEKPIIDMSTYIINWDTCFDIASDIFGAHLYLKDAGRKIKNSYMHTADYAAKAMHRSYAKISWT